MPIQINRYAYGHAAEFIETAHGPDIIKNALANHPAQSKLTWTPALRAYDNTRKKAALKQTADLCEQLARYTDQATKAHDLFITLGGDHSCAIGTWSGASAAAKRNNHEIGLIWIDAHMDAHTMHSSTSKNIHGMPLAALLGHGSSELTNLHNNHIKLKPHNVALIGIRSYEPEEAELLNKLGVKVYDMKSIQQMGLVTVMKAALFQVTQQADVFGITIDIDAIDPNDAPGTGTREPNGIAATELLDALPILTAHEKLIGAEIAEFNPNRDLDRKTEQIVLQLLNILFNHHIKKYKTLASCSH